MAAGTPLSAKNCKARFNNQILFCQKWTVKPKSTPLDVSNFEGGGFEDVIGGLRGLEVDFEGWWDGGANMFDAPLDVQDGVTLVNIKLYTNDTGSPYWNIPIALVTSVEQPADVHDRIMYRFSMKCKGGFVYPQGSAV